MNIMQKKIYLMLLAALALPLSSMSQEKSYSWNDLVDWNGISFWYEYLIMSPGYFGPNALPVPELSSGLIDTASSLDLRTDYYFAKGDQTVDLWGRYQHSFLKGKVSVFADITALEYYSITDTMIRNERKLRSEFPKGFVIGDLSFGTRVQILKNKKHWPDIVLESVFRTASGAHSGNGRYTDAPGYYFCINGGKDFFKSQHGMQFRYLFNAGFYAWQTNLRQYYQNDALLLAIGLEARKNNWYLRGSLNSYTGYIGRKEHLIMQYTTKFYYYDGDIPLVARLEYGTTIHQYKIYARYQMGLHDFPYQALSLGVVTQFLN